MSSDLLEQAMIDAAALKEAAMKNAENALIEKYSVEFNQTVQKLLEQEAPPATPDVAAPADPSAAPPTDATPTPDLSAAGSDPLAGGMDMAAQNDKAFSKVPGAFSGDDDQMITINFDQIKSTLNEMLGVQTNQDPAPDAVAQGKANPELVVKVKGSKNDVAEPVAVGAGDAEAEWQEYELEEDDSGFSNTAPEGELQELEEVELEEDVATAGVDDMKRSADLKKQAADAEQRANTAKAKAAEEEEKSQADAANAAKAASAQSAATAGTQIPTVAEDIELTEQELQELAEELKVDLKVGNLSDGYLGSTETQKREQRNVELAAARDEKAAAERAAEKEKMADLMKENAELKKLNSEALKAASMLKEQVEKLNVLNGKLLYTNKALANVSLNERQKSNIVESISKADSVLAAKTIYETVQNAVENTTKEQEAPQSLRETLNRAATPFVVKKSANNSISDLMAQRMKALAGIK